MTSTNGRTRHSLTPALDAVSKLLEGGFARLKSSGEMAALMANEDIKRTPVTGKSRPFYSHFLPLRRGMVAMLADSYRRYFKLALAHHRQAGRDPDKWAQGQLQPAVGAALEWIRDWYILACDGENQYVRNIGSTEFVPGQTVSLSIPTTAPPFPPPKSWRAPAWLFQVSLALFGVGLLKQKNIPAANSEEKLSAAHTRLLLNGARRIFLWELGVEIETVRNEETAAAGAIPVETVYEQTEGPSKRKSSEHRLKGIEGLVRKADLSQYMHNLTEKQQLAFSLKYEYQLGLGEIASRMGIDRKTA